jgi:hypothetical protein
MQSTDALNLGTQRLDLRRDILQAHLSKNELIGGTHALLLPLVRRGCLCGTELGEANNRESSRIFICEKCGARIMAVTRATVKRCRCGGELKPAPPPGSQADGEVKP